MGDRIAVFNKVIASLKTKISADTFHGEQAIITWVSEIEYPAAMMRLRGWDREQSTRQWQVMINQPGAKKKGTQDNPRLPVIEPPQSVCSTGVSNSTGIETNQAIEDQAAFDQAFKCMNDLTLENVHNLAAKFAEKAGVMDGTQDVAAAMSQRPPLAIEDVKARANFSSCEAKPPAVPIAGDAVKETNSGLCYARTHWVLFLVFPITISCGMLLASVLMCFTLQFTFLFI